mgnify:CR=1 FL=1
MPCPDTWLIEMAVSAEALQDAVGGAAGGDNDTARQRTLVGEAEYEIMVRRATPGRFAEIDF